MTLPNGYEMTTSFVSDFSVADLFGFSAVLDTYKRAFEEWKSNYIYLTELVVTLNLKIWQHYQKNEQLARLYNELWEKTQDYAYDTLKGKELEFFFQVTD